MKSVVVTGATGGIGSATVLLLAREGYRVHAVDIAGAKKELERFEPFGDAIRNRIADVANSAEMATLFAAIRDEGEELWGIVNNAAIAHYEGVIGTSEERWEQVLNVNVKGTYNTVHYGAPLMKGGGSIVNIASVHAISTGPRHAAYAASKGALEAMTRSLALELSPFGIRVNCVLPGAVRTSMLMDGLVGNNALEELRSRTPLRKIGEPEEIAQVIAFLLSEKASFMTGSSVVVDGGATALLATETLR